MQTTMIAMLAALTLYHTMHAIMEMKSVRYKLDRLDAKVSNTPFKEKSFDMDSMGKMVGMMMLMMGLMFALPFYILKTMGVPVPMLLKMSVMLLVIAEVATMIGYNHFHKKIGALQNKIK